MTWKSPPAPPGMTREMTLSLCYQEGHRRVRRPIWNPGNYVVMEDDGPTVWLFFPPGGVEEYACPARLFRSYFPSNDFEPYEGDPTPPRDGAPLCP